MSNYVWKLEQQRHKPINVPTAGAQAFPMDGIGRLGHDPPRGPGADWWVLTTANAAGTNGLTYLPKHGGARDSKFLVTHPMTDHCEMRTGGWRTSSKIFVSRYKPRVSRVLGEKHPGHYGGPRYTGASAPASGYVII
ncbi:hypothetical protein evm_003883 [Chilo suppressalis]|nr:hypothetical protein evm_003883 [Chilo suppressalis]